MVLIGLFTLADGCALALHRLHVQGVLPSRFFRLARDRGFAEIIQYAKLAVILWMLVAWRRARPARLLSAWIVLFAILLLDDALGIHEWLGGLLVSDTTLRGPFGVRAKDLAEVVPLIVLEGSALGYVFIEWCRADPLLRRASLWIAFGLIPFIASSLLLDLAPWPLVEQVGEMTSLSLLLLVAHTQFKAHGPRSLSTDRRVPHTREGLGQS